MPAFEFPMSTGNDKAEVILVIKTDTKDTAAMVANAILNHSLKINTEWSVTPNCFDEIETFGDPAREAEETETITGQHRPNLVYSIPMP